MNRFFIVFIVALIVLPLSFFGCKGKTSEVSMEGGMETTAVTPSQEEISVIEPDQNIAAEPIPPTAVPQIAEKPAAVSLDKQSRNKDIQTALRKAGFYTGAIDGKMGPKTKKAIMDFQKANGLKADGKVGPRTWAELAKHLVQQ